jgi:hypothetical protein
MLTLLMLGMMAAASGQQNGVEAKPAPWYTPKVQPIAPAFLTPQKLETMPPQARDFPDEQHPEVNCTLRIQKADPSIDPKMARHADKGIDPKIARPSTCKK